MLVVFTAIAQRELEDATVFYEVEQPGLGRRFKREIRASVNRVVAYPKACAVESGDVRKCLLHRFPYKILYSVEAEHIVVLAVAHCHRRPHYWVERRQSRSSEP